MCLSQVFYVEENGSTSSASIPSSSDSISLLEQPPREAALSLHSSFSFSDSSSNLLNRGYYADNNNSCSISESTSESATTADNSGIRRSTSTLFPVQHHLDRANSSQTQDLDPQRTIHRNRTSESNIARHHCTQSQSEQDFKSKNKFSSNTTSAANANANANHDQISSLLYYYYKKQQTKVAASLMLPILIMKMSNILIDHVICILTLIAIRYAATIKWRCFTNDDSNDDTRRRRKQSIDLVRTISDGMMMPCSSSLTSSTVTTTTSRESPGLEPSTSSSFSQPSFDGDSRDINEEIRKATTASTSTSTSTTTLSPASFIPSSEDDTSDEWGHFTDFDVDITSAMEDSMMKNSMNDPFSSITKSMLRKRGHKLSVCKLEQLQEEEEENDRDDF